MVHKVGEEIEYPVSVVDANNNPMPNESITYQIFNPNHEVFATGLLSQIGETGEYYKKWTPNVKGVWRARSYATLSNGQKHYDAKAYFVEIGVEGETLRWIKDSSGEWSFTTAETILIEKTSEIGIYGKINLSQMVANDAIRVRAYEKTKSGGTYAILEGGDNEYFNVQDEPIKVIGPFQSVFAIKVTIQRTAGSNDSKKAEYYFERDR